MGLNYTLARMTLWPETLWPGHFGQNDTLARVTFWPETHWPETVWPERQFGQCHFGWWHFGQWHFGQSDTLASDTLARVTLWPETLWPEWHFGQFFLLPLGYQRVNKNSIEGPLGKIWKKSWPFFSEKLWLFHQLWASWWLIFRFIGKRHQIHGQQTKVCLCCVKWVYDILPSRHNSLNL